MNTYLAFFKTQRIQVTAATSYDAQKIAAEKFKARKSYQVTVMLAEKDGTPVTHSTASI